MSPSIPYLPRPQQAQSRSKQYEDSDWESVENLDPSQAKSQDQLVLPTKPGLKQFPCFLGGWNSLFMSLLESKLLIKKSCIIKYTVLKGLRGQIIPVPLLSGLPLAREGLLIMLSFEPQEPAPATISCFHLS